MDVKEAIRILDPETTREALAEIEHYAGFRGREAGIKAVEDACRVAIEGMQKQVPIKPDGMRCQKCHTRALFVEDDYCPDCGQAIDWSKEG